MISQGHSLLECARVQGLVEAPGGQVVGIADPPSYKVMTHCEDESPEGSVLVKLSSQAAKTRTEPVALISEGSGSVSPSEQCASSNQPGQQKSNKLQQKIIQSALQKHNNLSSNTPQHSASSLPLNHNSNPPNQFASQKVFNKGLLGRKRVCLPSKYQDEDYNSSEVVSFQFPFANKYLTACPQQYYKTETAIESASRELNKLSTGSNTFINCDVRYFNWQLFGKQVGKFEVVIIDPPWRIKGAQQNDSQFMFSNCKFSLEYNTMANAEIARIPLHLLSEEGFIFLWILNSQLDASLELMENWGYQLVQQVIWVKLKDQKISLTHGYYFMHSYEVCLVGYKRGQSQTNRVKIRPNISWNTIFAEVRQKSQKPEEIYATIDIMFRGARKIEIFARNHNLRLGIFSVGNQLGQSYDKWRLDLTCDQCSQPLREGTKRYKSKHRPNYDLCPRCVSSKVPEEFFELANNASESVKHEYISCNKCGIEPIWGIRFHCNVCPDFDLCESCYDDNLREDKQFHNREHSFNFLEVPVFAHGFTVHQHKCASCYQNPIIGIHFYCTQCRNLHLCQKCYFERPEHSFNSLMRRHKPTHKLEVVFESQISETKKYECFKCKREVLEECWMCENCYNFFFCKHCYEDRDNFKSLFANTHKAYHTLSKIF